MYPNLEAEQVRRGHTDEHIAEMLGITLQEYRARKESKTMRLQEAVVLAGMYGEPTEYLFGSGI